MEQKIEKVLLELKQTIETWDMIPDYIKSSSSFNGFEHLVSDVLKYLSANFLTHNIRYAENFGHFFPDIDIFIDNVKFGLELKSKTDGSWVNNGGSVFESISDTNYEEIFVLFGTINKSKKETHYKVKYAPYWQVAEAIKVTHKPRYFLNMNAKDSIFTSKEDYKNIRKMNELEKNTYVQKKLKESANKPQWYIADNDLDSVNPTLISELPKATKENVISELLVLFPQDFLRSKSNYDNATEYLISAYFYYTPSLRDLFSAGGKFDIHGVKFPRIVNNIIEHKKEIHNILANQSADFKEKAYESWSKLPIELTRTSLKEDYKKTLDYLGRIFLEEELNSAHIDKLSSLIFD